MRFCVKATMLAVLACVAGAAVSGSARAADLASLKAYEAHTVSTAVYDWTGFYVGAHAGAALPPDESAGSNGMLGGLQLGYLLQSNSLVAGIEADFGAAHTSGAHSPDWLGSVRARAGIAVDGLLLYGTGGVAFGNIGHADLMPGERDWSSGWVFGIGAEAAIARNWTARVEAFHYNLGHADGDSAAGPLSLSRRATVVRAGVDYRY